MRRRRLSLWAFLWPAAALGAFAALQVWRIGVLDCLRRTRPPPPSLYTELSAWSAYAQVAEPDVYAAFRPLQAVWNIRKDHPVILVDMAACGVGLAVVGWVTAFGFLTATSFACRRLPRSMTLRYRLRIAFAAFAMGTPWGIPFGIVVGAGVWFIGFDRNGTGRPMIDALAPTPAQACAILFAWSTFIGMAGGILLYRAATMDGPACLRCGYPRAGLSADRCPECGRPLDNAAPAPPSARACHAAIARWTAVLAFAVASLATIAAVVHPTARDWIQLRAGRAERRALEVGLLTFSPGTFQTRSFECTYGTITLHADESPGGDGSSGAVWTINWRLVPGSHSPLSAASGTITVPTPPKPLADFSRTYRRLPFGELCFYQVSTPHVLSVAGNRLIFTPEKWPPTRRAPDASTAVRLAALARARYGRRFLLLPLAALLLVAAAWIAFPFFFERYGHLSPIGWRAPLDLVAAVWVFGLVLAPAGAFAAVRRGMVVRCLRLQRSGPCCPACAFSLIGLPRRDGVITCPECGRAHPFA